MQVINRRITVLFVVTNGIGLGHITRGLAVAKRLIKSCEYMDAIFFTTSIAIDGIRQQGFTCYYYPSYEQLKHVMTEEQWQGEMKRQVSTVMSRHDAKGIVYDGAYPYESILQLLDEKKEIVGVWLKREGDKITNSQYDLNTQQHFNRIIVPKEAGYEYSSQIQASNKVYCNTIMLLDQEEAMTRNEVRSMFGINRTQSLYYLQLGAGKINRIDDSLHMIVDTICKNKTSKILLGESIIGNDLKISGKQIIPIREYPNARYFKGIDYAISAAGYNTFHELLYFGVPTIFIPNRRTGKDNQMARAMRAETEYAGVTLAKVNSDTLQSQMDYIQKNRYTIARNAKNLVPSNGAREAADIIVKELHNRYW